MQKEQYDDEFLLLLIEYRSMYPESEHFDIFYGRYAFFYGNCKVALEHAGRAFKKRKVHPEVWKLFIDCYLALGMPERAIPFQGYCNRFAGMALEITLPLEHLARCIGELAVSLGRAEYAPLCQKKCSLINGKLDCHPGAFSGEAIPFSLDGEGYAYWVGAYNELGRLGGHGGLMESVASSLKVLEAAGAEFVFDIMRSKVGKNFFVDTQETPVIVPLASAAEENQEAHFECGTIVDSARLGQWEYSFFRVEQPTRISAEQPLAMGCPIPLRHSSKRRKFVLNILVDALSWNVYRRQATRYMPRMMEFFSRGVIFDQFFSVCEYTYPSLASIETGMYPHHSQIFTEQAAVRLDEGYVTLSERMKALGYYCVNVMGVGNGVYNGVMKGYDRLLVTAYDLPAYAGVERVIRQLEAFSECDQFLFLHLMELHPWSSRAYHVGVEAQTKTSLQNRLNGKERKVPSVYLPDIPFYRMANQQALVHVDRSLAMLFDYIMDHYGEDEYILQLYSDHGVPIYDETPFVLSENHNNAVYMLRGYGVPEKGLVDELVSAVDIYPVLAKLAGFPVEEWVDGNLPAVFGGKERECVYSNSLFPGQTYKLSIRTKEHEFYMESRDPVTYDGTVDLSGAKTSIRTRGGLRCVVKNPALEQRFLELARNHTDSINNEGRQWHSIAQRGALT